MYKKDCFCIAPVIRRIADDRKLQKAVLFVCPSGAVAEHFVRRILAKIRPRGRATMIRIAAANQEAETFRDMIPRL